MLHDPSSALRPHINAVLCSPTLWDQLNDDCLALLTLSSIQCKSPLHKHEHFA